MEIVWKSAVLVAAATILLRFSGKKSISEMTIASTVIMISIGEILVRPVINQKILPTLGAVAAFLGTSVLLEYIQLKFNIFEKFLSGKAITIIENGKPVVEHLKKTRLTVDDLEMRLREKGISSVSEVKCATLEMNGQIGYELMDHAKPVTTGQLEQLLSSYGIFDRLKPSGSLPSENLFHEVENNGHSKAVPTHLQ